jgi:uncharacterized protein
MIVGTCRIELFLPNNGSLKDKRRSLNSVKEKLKNKFNVSVAEIDGHDLWQRTVLGMALVGNEKRHVNEVLDKAIEQIRRTPLVESYSAIWKSYERKRILDSRSPSGVQANGAAE